MTKETELNIAIEKCRRLKDAVRLVSISLGDTLTDTGNGAIENVVTSREFEREGDSLDVHESTNNDSIGPTNERPIYGIQPENATTHADEMNFNANLQGLIHSIKAENIKAEGSFREDEPILDVNGQENTETISQIPPVSTEPTAVVETQENVTNPTTNSENTSALNAKSESPVNVSTVPIGLRLDTAHHNSVAITTGRTPRISRRNPKPSPERRYPKRSIRRPAMEALNNYGDDEDEYAPVPKRTSNKPSMSRNKRSRIELDNDFHSYKSSLLPVASPKTTVRRRILRRKTWQTSDAVLPPNKQKYKRAVETVGSA
ncbi:hypothetical protein Ddc_21334 [Ditylenchus destructor]|nr:hypothetical protein Ddc_21334 [Ditylenchus destructor]